jgi:formate hydrogenlyase subunit 3/multisubunit Na+/H+ antiporter MnhD subunit
VVVACVTILYGSIRALGQDELKRRLAYSTISQVAYIVLGTALASPLATMGGVVHLVHQGVMKITLFFCAGNLAETLGMHYVSEMNGVARRLPWTMTAFTIGALGMIGMPPLAGFVSKWFLGIGAVEAGEPWVIAVLASSTLLNAAYFLPIVHAAWFKPPVGPWPEEHHHGRCETPWTLLLPRCLPEPHTARSVGHSSLRRGSICHESLRCSPLPASRWSSIAVRSGATAPPLAPSGTCPHALGTTPRLGPGSAGATRHAG